MLVDTHTHVQFRGFKEEADQVMNRALEAGVIVINVGTQKDTSKEAVDMLSKYPNNVYAVVGLHPIHTYSQYVDEEESSFLTREEVFDYEYYKELASNPRVVGIGECGFDYYRLSENEDPARIKKLQLDAFMSQIKLALELDKVLCIHTRPSPGTMDAYQDLAELISSFVNRHSPFPKFEVHCYTGNLEYARKFVSLGGYIGVNGIVTFDKTGIAEEVVKNIPLESILLETDAPYLTPMPLRGKKNEPSYIRFVAEKIASVRGESLMQVESITTENAKKLFSITD